MACDIIGDVHGQGDKLVSLLKAMHYVDRGGAWRHPSRQAIFVGDLIDRGPRQRETVELVRAMVDAGSALCVMGNHEFNAIAWHLEDPADPGHFLRPRHDERGEKNRDQHQAFLAEVEGRPDLHREYVEFFLRLPLWLDLPGLRVVHACWHDGHRAAIEPLLGPGRTLTPDLMVAASRKGRMEFQALEALTKGLEVPLPAGCSFQDKDGHVRRAVRVRWWDRTLAHFRDAALLDGSKVADLPESPVPEGALVGYDSDKPVFFGHYWMRGRPRLLSPKVACLDYSAGTDGPLVAYRWDGEAELSESKFVRSAP